MVDVVGASLIERMVHDDFASEQVGLPLSHRFHEELVSPDLVPALVSQLRVVGQAPDVGSSSGLPVALGVMIIQSVRLLRERLGQLGLDASDRLSAVGSDVVGTTSKEVAS